MQALAQTLVFGILTFGEMLSRTGGSVVREHLKSYEPADFAVLNAACSLASSSCESEVMKILPPNHFISSSIRSLSGGGSTVAPTRRVLPLPSRTTGRIGNTGKIIWLIIPPGELPDASWGQAALP